MNVRIRRAMVSDSHRIFELCRNELNYEFAESQVESNLRRMFSSRDNIIVVAVDEYDNAIGFIHAGIHEPVYAPPMVDVMAIAVNPEARNHGLGSLLLAEVEKWARANGAQGVRTNSDSAQEFALRFYKRNGYTYIRTAYNMRKMF